MIVYFIQNTSQNPLKRIMPFFIQLAQTLDFLFRKGKWKWQPGHHVVVEINGQVWEAVAKGFVKTSVSAFRVDYFQRMHYKIIERVELPECDFDRFKDIQNAKYDYFSLLFAHWIQSLSQIVFYLITYGFVRSGLWLGRRGSVADNVIYCNEAVSYMLNQPQWWRQLPYQSINYAKSWKTSH